jgi:hypothetical protein
MRFLPAILVLIALCTMAEARDPRVPKQLMGDWCLVESKPNPSCPRSDVLTITPSKVIVWSVAPGSAPVELEIKDLHQKGGNTWEVDFGEESGRKEVWSISGTRLITHDGRGHTHSYIRRK